ncbi:MAG: hypothetical protein JWP25_2942 [Bradyrhizobium sp.]|nr:hypothetical protein [Bradyrhizobium sp.]
MRYATADDESRPPQVRVLVNPKYQKNVELVLSPDNDDAVLWRPGSCLVVRASKPGQLLVEVVPVGNNGSTAATVQIETLSQGEVASTVRRELTAEVDFAHLSLLGHVAGSGDVHARADEWIAGPGAPARIEGLLIDWPGKPDDLDIRYSVKLARPHAASGRITELGGYAGTRGLALPIVSVTVELTGPGASDFQLSAEAAFLGAPLTRMSGKQVAISGPTGREPLVGFRLRLDETNMPLQPQLPPVTKAKPSGRVRIFRSPNNQSRLRTTLESFCELYSATG